ncbi:hypothetical protein ACWGIV_22685 [Streptomyces sp. NPDC054844]
MSASRGLARAEFPVVGPDDLAEQYWDMYTERDRIGQLHPRPRNV